MDVYSGPAFVWAEAVGASLTALRCPFVVTLHSGAFPDFAERWPARVRRLLRSATVVTSPSPFLREHFRQIRPDIRVIRNGLHLERYPARRITKAKPRLVLVRAFEQRYNPLLALEVVSILSGEFPDIELLMVGPDTSDWSADETLAHALKLGVADRVHVMGQVSKMEIPQVLQQGDIFLNTTNVDNAPVTVIEAMACGLCVVSTNAGGVPYLTETEQDALLVPRADPDAMATAVRRVLVEPGLSGRLSENARRKAESYDWDRVLPAWEDLLVEVVMRR